MSQYFRLDTSKNPLRSFAGTLRILCGKTKPKLQSNQERSDKISSTKFQSTKFQIYKWTYDYKT